MSVLKKKRRRHRLDSFCFRFFTCVKNTAPRRHRTPARSSYRVPKPRFNARETVRGARGKKESRSLLVVRVGPFWTPNWFCLFGFVRPACACAGRCARFESAVLRARQAPLSHLSIARRTICCSLRVRQVAFDFFGTSRYSRHIRTFSVCRHNTHNHNTYPERHRRNYLCVVL